MILEGNPRVRIEPLKVCHMAEFFDGPPPSAKGVAFFYDDRLAGIAGVRFHRGLFVVFSDIKSDINVSGLTIYRCAKLVMDMCKDTSHALYATCDNEKSGRLLRRLGWSKDFKGDEGWVYRWVH